ncbi:aldehyde dehydrogenase family protein [Lederbergia galactosidilytica]|uniref:3-sulfolactaldehyde dehydrogenase n=1 Tax=Lederbergia galactosidilytica TaxID=217031 RepID=A0A177ZIJ3_9BACI|nr:aldehyde dehydrogenase family protein [Lederbergia galactosidilytica]KRG13810.1 aldehyde dehydrogenase [Virgibacillus soli]OAK67433.1 aldehyde dehydrogenase [Lederbergia galactosidilytica]
MDKYSGLNKQFIAGEWRDGSSEEIYEDKNPYNQEVVTKIKMATQKDIDEAYESAKQAQKDWEKVNAFEKSEIMTKAVQIMKERREELVELLTIESGSSYIKANVEVDFCISITKEAASYPMRMGGEIVPSLVPGKENRLLRRPLGVLGVISPFNFPMYLSMRSVATALAAGNGVVLKPDEQTAMSGGTIIAKIFEEAGLPKGLFNVVIASIEEIGDGFVDHPIPRMISFTGSTPVGKHIGELCGKNIKKVALELGGNNALIVLEDANLEEAVHSAIFGKFMHNGQICMAINRIIVAEKVHDEFLEKFIEAAKKISVGDPTNQKNMIGPLINPEAVKRIVGEIEKAKTEGAKVVLEGKVEGSVIHPTVLTSNTNNVATAQNEMFGPVVTIIPFSTEEEAIEMCNDTPYGLSGAVHAGSIEKGVEIALQLETGMVHINDQSVNDEPLIAFGGEKQSGIGRFGGRWSLDEFTTFQWISAQNQHREYPF